MRKKLEALWFQPYTPVVIIVLIILGIAKGVYPTVQKAITGQKIDVPLPIPPTSPTPFPDQKSLLEAIGKLIMLPPDESPQVIPITQIDQFKDQPFFRHAKNGDILLVYSKNKKAILYDPADNRILDTAPLGPGSQSAQSTPPQAGLTPVPSGTGQTPTPTPTLAQSGSPPSPTATPTPTPTNL